MTATDWALSRPFMLRLAGLPVDAVAALRSPAAAAWAEEVLDAEEALLDQGRRLSDPLAAVVGATEDDALRRDVLKLRRAVFNNRRPREASAALALAERIGGEAGDLLGGWLKDRVRLDALLADGPALFGEQLDAARAALRSLAADERIREGLLLASAALDGQLDGYLRAGKGGLQAKRERKIERSLLAYLYRTACKTSPFSTFTGVALGAFDPTPEGGAAVEVTEEWTSHPRLNVVVLWRLAQVVADDPERRGDLPVTLASGWDLDDERVRYVRRSMTPGDDAAAVSFDAAQDRLFYLRRRGVLDSMLTLFAERETIRHRELVEWLGGAHGALRADAERYLAALLQLGMVQMTGLQPAVHSPDPLRDFQRALCAVDRPWALQAAGRLDGTRARVAEYPAASLARRRQLLAELRGELQGFLDALGASEATLPRTLLYEDTRASAAEVVADPAVWREHALPALASLGRVLPAFDVSLPQRLTLRGFFLARYGHGGRCDDVLKLVHDFHEDIFDQYLTFTAEKAPVDGDGYAAEENWLGLPQVTALDRARTEWVGRMRTAWRECPPDAEEIRLEEAAVDAVAAELAPLGGSFDPHSHFLQLADRPDGPLVVLNGSFGGLSFPFTRFTHCFDEADGLDLSGRLREQLRRVQPPGAVFAEVTAGAATTNLNLHGHLTDYQILCPGETSSAPPQAHIHLDDLYVEHDVARDRLVVRSRRLGLEVVPLYLGYLVPMVLPEIPRTLLLLSPTSKATVRLWTGVPEGPAVDGVTRRPRVRLGALVLGRRSWTVPDGSFPVAASGDGEPARFLGWRRWRRAHGVPARVFARVFKEAAGAGWSGGSKPHFVDFDSPLSLGALEGLLGEGFHHVVLEETLPGQDDLHVRTGRGRHVAELAVETIPVTANTAQETEN